jgi:hypothetical protein
LGRKAEQREQRRIGEPGDLAHQACVDGQDNDAVGLAMTLSRR